MRMACCPDRRLPVQVKGSDYLSPCKFQHTSSGGPWQKWGKRIYGLRRGNERFALTGCGHLRLRNSRKAPSFGQCATWEVCRMAREKCA